MIINQTYNNPNFTGSAQMRFYNSNGKLLENFDVTKGIAGKIFDSIRSTKAKDEFIKHDAAFKSNQIPELGHVDDFILTGETAKERHEIGRKLRESGARIAQIAKNADSINHSADLALAHQGRQSLLGKYYNNATEVKADRFKDRIKDSDGLLELQVVVEEVKGKLKIIEMMFKKAGSEFKKRPLDKVEQEYLTNNSSILIKHKKQQPRKFRATKAHGVFQPEPPVQRKRAEQTPGQLELF